MDAFDSFQSIFPISDAEEVPTNSLLSLSQSSSLSSFSSLSSSSPSSSSPPVDAEHPGDNITHCWCIVA
ncbi:hypothetical protein EVG20_g5503 [Dentipellis fragilis]|uniref:Pheromone n=1 Tax=Dentipellis fragilis TaxID=205917 RepID=A0A4Y9YV39_9AGAM|nr:hypothetical protein EVG20_g5503 [Dentipellis fragilis]